MFLGGTKKRALLAKMCTRLTVARGGKGLAGALVSRTARADEYGTVMGWYQAAGAVGRVIGPGISGALHAGVALGAPFAVAAAVMLPVLGFVALFRDNAPGRRGGSDDTQDGTTGTTP